jgi:hypothetical protein
MTAPAASLILVYNADSGLLNMVKDAVWKVVRPATYPCSLCALTYGWVAMHGTWRRFLDGLPHAKVFHHRDDFAAAFPGLRPALPAILLAGGDAAPRVLVSAAELDGLPDLDALIALVDARLAGPQYTTVGASSKRQSSRLPTSNALAKASADGARRRIRITPLSVGELTKKSRA